MNSNSNRSLDSFMFRGTLPTCSVLARQRCGHTHKKKTATGAYRAELSSYYYSNNRSYHAGNFVFRAPGPPAPPASSPPSSGALPFLLFLSPDPALSSSRSAIARLT